MALKSTENAGKGYKSPIDLQIGQMPRTEDPKTFSELVEVYNAIHLLNAYLDSLRGTLDVGKKGKPFDEQLIFKQGLWHTAGEDIAAGDQICIFEGFIKKGVAIKRQGIANLVFGIALGDAKEGEECQMGIGPAIIKVEGAKAREIISGCNTGSTDSKLRAYRGKLIRGIPAKRGFARIGECFIDDYVILYGPAYN